MEILTFNCGSSTLKFQFVEVEREETSLGRERRLAYGTIDRIGGQGAIQFTAKNGVGLSEATSVADHGEGTRRVLDWLSSLGLLERYGLEAVGHRLVHGGDRFLEPTLINDEVINAIEAISHLAPLHNAPALSAIRAARAILGSAIPQVKGAID